LLCGKHEERLGGPGHFIYAAFNSWIEPLEFLLPVLPRGKRWHLFANTATRGEKGIYEQGSEVLLDDQKKTTVHARSCVILVGK
jgi:glycogen operon protein